MHLRSHRWVVRSDSTYTVGGSGGSVAGRRSSASSATLMATSSCGSRPCDAVLWCDDDLDIGVDAVVLDTHPCPSSQNAKRGAAGPVDRDRAAVAADSDRARLAALSRTGQLHVHESRFGVTGHRRRSIQRPQLARSDVHDRLPVRGRVAYVELVPGSTSGKWGEPHVVVRDERGEVAPDVRKRRYGLDARSTMQGP